MFECRLGYVVRRYAHPLQEELGRRALRVARTDLRLCLTTTVWVRLVGVDCMSCHMLNWLAFEGPRPCRGGGVGWYPWGRLHRCSQRVQDSIFLYQRKSCGV